MSEYEILKWLTIGSSSVAIAYAVTRAVAAGYFHSKREHFDKIWRRVSTEEDKNGS